MNLLSLAAATKSISTKNSLVILSIAIAIIIILVYSNKEFYVSTQDKIKALNDLYELKARPNLDSVTLVYLNTLNKEIIREHSVQENLTDYFLSIFNPSRKSFFSDSRNQFLQFLTSSYVWILFILVIPFAGSTPKKTLIKEVYTDIKTFFLLLIFAFANCFLFNLIPIIYMPWINYILNIFLQAIEFYWIKSLWKYARGEEAKKPE